MGRPRPYFFLGRSWPNYVGLNPHNSAWLNPMYLFIYYNNIYYYIWNKKTINSKKKNLSKFFDFLAYFSINFALYWFAFLHCKDTNPVLKYLIFSKMLQKKYRKQKKISCFHAYDHVSKKCKNFISYFHTKISRKRYVLACILNFNNQFIKAMRTRAIFQKYKKTILFSFSIWDYKLIRKTYSLY